MNNQSVFSGFPDKQTLLDELISKGGQEVLLVNGHFHTPFSFSAFTEIEQAFRMAKDEGVQVLGINDFYTTDGYSEFSELAQKYKTFPLFNIEFMALQRDLQANGIRVNDPANPGRTYMSGKGLNQPFKIGAAELVLLEQVQHESNVQTAEMVEKLNAFLTELKAGFSFDFDELKAKYAKNMLRERHIAKALRVAIDEKFTTPEEKKTFYTLVFSGKEVKSDLNDVAGLENEIRGNLLKAGGKAFVTEDPKAFLPMQTVCDIIVAGGGIPTYPFLADDAKGGYTDFEGDLERVAKQLTERGFHSVEFITTRNGVELLEKYASYLHEQGFVVTFGSEHNTPAMEPIELFARNSTPLTDRLMQINYEGACVVASHQHLVAQGLRSYVDANGQADRSKREEFIKLGDELIQSI